MVLVSNGASFFAKLSPAADADVFVTLFWRVPHLTVVVFEDGVVRVRDDGGLVGGLVVFSVVVDCQVEDCSAPVAVILLERS